MRITKISYLEEKFPECDITTETGNFYIFLDNNTGILVHNSPAIISGINPENGKFFVGTKSVFAGTPKLNYTASDIDRNHPNPGLNTKLKIALENLPKLGIQGIVQGDLLFDRATLGKTIIDGQACLTFQPNTITYAVPLHSHLAQSMMQAKMGIIFHTSYYGKTMKTLKASFRVPIGSFNITKDVWFKDATFTDSSGVSTMTIEEKNALTKILSQAGILFKQQDPRVINYFAINDTIRGYWDIYHNSQVREGSIAEPRTHVIGFINWVTNTLDQDVQAAKKPETKKNRLVAKAVILEYLRKNQFAIMSMVAIMNLIVEAKLMVIKKLASVQDIGTFLKTSDGYKVTAPEGFVCIDHIGNARKLVDRLEFSRANFTAPKNWVKEEADHLSHSLRLPREHLPQIAQGDLEDYKSWLSNHDVSWASEKIPAGYLKATQHEIDLEKVRKFDDDGLDKPVIVSNDNYLVDGHHRWIAILNQDPDYLINAIRVHVPIQDLLALTKSYPKSFTGKRE